MREREREKKKKKKNFGPVKQSLGVLRCYVSGASYEHAGYRGHKNYAREPSVNATLLLAE